MLAGGCDAPSEIAGQLEQTLRDNAATRQKAGTLRALQVSGRAHRIARAMASHPEAACRLELPDAGPFTYRVTLDVERRPAGQRDDAPPEAHWHEQRVLRRDADGDLSLQMDARYRDEIGLRDRRAPAWRVVGARSYVSVDGEAYYRRDLAPGEPARIKTAGLGVIQTLLDAASAGWSRAGEGRWTLGGEALGCGPADAKRSGWLRRFATHATALSGALEVADGAAGPRRLKVRWQLDDGSTLRLRFSDTLALQAEAVDPPAPDAIVEVERDRSYARVSDMLDTFGERGWITEGPGSAAARGDESRHSGRSGRGRHGAK